jgi:hypothetical protein
MTSQFAPELSNVLKELARCIVGLGPYQQDVVLSGGLVPVMYRRVFQNEPKLKPLTTFDLDWSVPQPLAERGENLHDRMLKAGFEAYRSGSAKLPVIQYVPAGKGLNSPIYVEFITPRKGGKYNREGDNQGIVEVQSGLFAQTDPYLGLLLAETIPVNVASIPELELSDEHSFRVPNPMCFIVQKILIRENRGQRKQENDACHIYDVAILTHNRWQEMRAALQQIVDSKQFPSKWFSDARAVLQRMFESSTSAGPLAVTKNYPGMTSAEEVVRAMAAFLDECWK